jgi:tetratricopeptide (TPR) repeat protein
MQRLTLLILILLACSAFAQQKKANSDQAIDLFKLGEKAINERSYRTALAHFNECLRIDPFFWDAYSLRAFSKEKLNDQKGALTDYNIYLESHPEDNDALFARAILRFNYGQWEVAKEDFSKLSTQVKSETNALFFQTNKEGQATKIVSTQSNMSALYQNYLGLIDWKMLRYKESIYHLDSAIKLDIKNTDYWLNRGLIKQAFKDTLGARTDFEKAVELDPSNALAAHNIAVLSGFKGNLKDSEKQLTEVIRNNPSLSYPFAERGYVRSKLTNWKGALEDFNSAILIEKNDPTYYFNRGIAKEKLKDFTGALADFTYATNLKPDFDKAWLTRGNLLTKMKRLKEAIQDYTIAISLYDGYGIAYYNRSLAYHKLGNLKEACLDLQTAQRYNMPIDAKVMQSICK